MRWSLLAACLLVGCGSAAPETAAGGDPEAGSMIRAAEVLDAALDARAPDSPAADRPQDDAASDPPGDASTPAADAPATSPDVQASAPDAGGPPPPPKPDAAAEGGLRTTVYPVNCKIPSGTYLCDGTSTGGYNYAVSWTSGGTVNLCGDPGVVPCQPGDPCRVIGPSTSVDGTCL